MSSANFTPRLPVAEGTDSSRLCKICDLSEWDNQEFRELSGRIMTGDPQCLFRHRKLWEFTKVVQALQKFDLLREDSLGLSVAGGSERILFYLANKIGRIVATDIYGSGSFVENESKADFLEDQSTSAPYAYRKDHLKVLWMNAFDLLFPEGVFDFTFCLSSVEHFGGVSAAAQAIREMGKVVRPGGLICIATECAINGIPWEEAFSPNQLVELCKEVGMPLIEPIDFTLGKRSMDTMLDLRKDKLDVEPHINLCYFGSVFTSVMLVFRKEGEVQKRQLTIAEFDEIVEKVRIESEAARKNFVFSSKRRSSFLNKAAKKIALYVGERFR